MAIANYGTVVAVDKVGRKTKFRSVTDPDKLEEQISQAAGLDKAATTPAQATGPAPPPHPPGWPRAN